MKQIKEENGFFFFNDLSHNMIQWLLTKKETLLVYEKEAMVVEANFRPQKRPLTTTSFFATEQTIEKYVVTVKNVFALIFQKWMDFLLSIKNKLVSRLNFGDFGEI